MRCRRLLPLAAVFFGLVSANAEEDGDRVLLWGDTHLHTNYSFDAYLFQNRTGSPDDAYRFAKGEPILHPVSKDRIAIETPLDFLVVADHAELTAVPKRIFEQDEALMKSAFGRRIAPMIKDGKGAEIFAEIVRLGTSGFANPELTELVAEPIRRPAWEDLIAVADKHNEPGKFTTLIGWEWSSLPDAANLHRVVFMAQGAEVAGKFLPYSSTQSNKPEDLWKWLEETESSTGAEFVAIPHNMNISKGLMFPEQDSQGRPITAEYARTRMRWEPVAEVTQYKGDSETHPLLSPNDEFADFETYRHLIDTRPDTDKTAPVTPGDYARSALLRGMAIEQTTGANPYKFGMIGATDAHTSIASAEEGNFFNKFPYMTTPEARSRPRAISSDGPTGWDMGAQGLAAVWAEENSRDAIVAAFKRKEVYATTGPRMKVRMFGGWGFAARHAKAKDIGKTGYNKGVPMGGDLGPQPDGLFGKKTPSFLVQAVKDPKSGNLDRIQMVKGWIDAVGNSHEKVYNIAASDGRKPNSDGKLEPVGNTVDLKTSRYTNSIGADELVVVWKDTDFDPSQRAFYYVRVLEIPTPRHSLGDMLAMGKDLSDPSKLTIQERAYTSPIWYTP